VSKSGTDAVANDAAIKRIHPRLAVPATPIRIASGAARALWTDSSETCAADWKGVQMEIERFDWSDERRL
jgi:hypothetical protein